MKKSRFDSRIRRRAGFTLVEMLVAVALVLLMMSLFATAFVSATQTLSTQRGIAENDQRGRMLSTTIRSDLNARTFLDVLPFRAGADQHSTSSIYRKGYFEIDEGDPNDDTDDVLQFTASMGSANLPTTNANQNGTRYTGLTNNLTSLTNTTTTTNYVVVDAQTIKVNGNYASQIRPSSYLQIFGSASTLGTGGAPYTNDGRYIVNGTPVWDGSTYTTIQLAINLTTTPIEVAGLTVPTAAASGSVLLSVDDTDFDDGIVANGVGASASAEICYFLRFGNLYRRVLLIRDNPNAQSVATAIPQWSSGSTISPLTATTFWRDFDYSAFNIPTSITSQVAIQTSNTPTFQILPATPFPTLTANSCAFNEASDSLTNTYQTDPVALSTMLSLGLPYQRFGHSTNNGLPQDASSLATLGGTIVPIGRFNLQECASYNPVLAINPIFGYPATLPPDPITGTGSISPFDRQNVVVNAATGLVNEYSTTNNRRGEDILMTNVLSFDVKVWDPINAQFVDIGSSNPAGGPFSSAPTIPNPTGTVTPLPGTIGANYSASGVLYNVTDTAGSFTVVGGRLNSTYASTSGPLDTRPHYRFDTWHPNAAIQTGSGTVGSTLYNQPPYFQPDPNTNTYTAPYTYNEPPIHPAAQLTTGIVQDFPLAAIQITINYRDVSSGQIRSMTIVQSLIYNEQQMNVQQFVAPSSPTGTVYIPTLN